MGRPKKNAPSVVIDNMISIGDPFVSKFSDIGWLAITGRLSAEPDRHASVFFTNPANARRVAEALIAWADATDRVHEAG